MPRTGDTLQKLFYPTPEDIEHSRLTKDYLKLPLDYEEGNRSLPQLTHPQSFLEYTFRWWRPGSLTELNDANYMRAFEWLLDHSGESCPTWQYWTTEQKQIQEPLVKVLKHIVVWFDPTFRYPSQNENRLQTFRWTTTITETLMKCKLPAGSQRGFSVNDEGGYHREAQEYLETLWTFIDSDPNWKDAELKKQVCNLFPLKLTMIT
ncbi:hypothetical protein ASPFODRAFT_702048 [Aspergillus luchuensis CBS 106.47]|uniref:Uncharacterized protein n=1 Tax=Aspergillus luchuensis (strain CBS 106.47) TaxID=1137211 RepID=A0A1M3T583_ASPLC|nr:hypothetical protein ASPFODRAFT_702048 [Aspergillus luchuensis CBS 106.47]